MAPARYLVLNPCEDACGTLTTQRTVEGAPVYLCPGCDSEWIELHERTEPAEAAPPTQENPTTDPRTDPAAPAASEQET